MAYGRAVNAAPFALLAFGSLFAIVSPFATVPTFLAITEDDSTADRLAMARRACMIACLVLLTFAMAGTEILGAFQVSVPALRIAGGLVILRVAFDMLQGTQRKLTPEERQEGIRKHDVAVTPLAVPILCGPGTVTTGIVLGSQANGILEYAVLALTTLVVYAATFGLLWLGVRYSAVFGQLTLKVVGRLMGMLLAAIAVEFMLAGWREAWPQIAS